MKNILEQTVNNENNSSSYFPLLTATITITNLYKNKLRKGH
jgi:hypothetical protein